MRTSNHSSRFIEMFGPETAHQMKYPVKKVGDLAECYAGATPSTTVSEYWDNGTISWMSSGEVHLVHVDRTEAKITQKGYDHASTKMVPIHSVVIALAGQGKTRGTVAITEIPLCTNQSLCAIVPGEELHYEYLFHNLNGRYLELRSMAGDVNGRGGLNLRIIQNIPIVVPPMDDQLAFVMVARQADKSKFNGFKSRFIEMFGNHSRKQLLDIASSWDKGQPFKKDSIVENGSRPCIHYGELYKYGPIIDRVVSLTNEVAIKKSKTGDILFPASDVTPYGLARCSALMIEGVLLGGDIIVLRISNDNSPEYVSYAINMQQDQLIRRVTGSVVRHMSAKSLKTVDIPIPSLYAQLQFVSLIRQADKSKYLS